MNKYVEGLREALYVWQEDRGSRRTAEKLVLFDLFTQSEIYQITGKFVKEHPTIPGYVFPDRKGVLKAGSLDALFLIAEEYKDTHNIRGKLARSVVAYGTSMNTVAALTGIPLDDLREAIRNA